MSEYTTEGFADIFQSLTKKYETATIFTEFLKYSISQLSNIEWKQTYEYSEEEKQTFYQLFSYWLLLMDEKLEDKEWYDFFGEFYEEYILAKFKAGDKGQFFTSPEVSDLMARLCNPYIEDGCSYDPTCGSGRNLLAAHMKDMSLICVGWDLDEQACKMCVLNFIVHGVNGVVYHADTLRKEFYHGWRVNKYLNNYGVIGVEEL